MITRYKLLKLPDFIVEWLGKTHAKKGLISVDTESDMSSYYLKKIRIRAEKHISIAKKSSTEKLEPNIQRIAFLEKKLEMLPDKEMCIGDKNADRISKEINDIKMEMAQLSSAIEFTLIETLYEIEQILLCYKEIEKTYLIGAKPIINKEGKYEI